MEILTTETNSSKLHEVSHELTIGEIKSTTIQELVAEMITTAEQFVTKEGWKSAGLAAIQVGRPVRLFVAKNAHSGEFFAYINPKLELLGEATDIRQESCLSIPGVVGEVKRHKRIRLSYLNKDGNPHVDKFDGYEARILQHEYDHLEGILFTDILVTN